MTVGMFSKGGAAPSVPPPAPPPPAATSVIGMDPETGHPTIKGFVPDVAEKPKEPSKPAQASQAGQALGGQFKKAIGGLYPFNLLPEPGKPGPAPDAKP